MSTRLIHTTWCDVPVVQDEISGRYLLSSICRNEEQKHEILTDELVNGIGKEIMKREHEPLFKEINGETFIHPLGMHSVVSMVNPQYFAMAMKLISLKLEKERLERQLAGKRVKSINETLDDIIEKDSQEINKMKK